MSKSTIRQKTARKVTPHIKKLHPKTVATNSYNYIQAVRRRAVPPAPSESRADGTPRVRQVTRHSSFRLSPKVVKKSQKPLPGVGSLIAAPLKLIRKRPGLYLGLLVVYSLLQFVLIQGFGSAYSLLDTKSEVQAELGEEGQSFDTTYALLTFILTGSNTEVTDVANTYQVFLTVIIILAAVWLTRQIMAGERPRMRDGFYQGMYPLVPFILVGVVMSLQLIPLLIGAFIYSTVIGNGLAVTLLEQVLWAILCSGFAILSFYMILSSLFALCIATLNDVTPLQALRSARGLVLHRRLGIFARLIAAPLLGLLLLVVILLPLIAYVPIVVEPLYLVLTSFGIVYMTMYIYNFYRELL